MAKSLQDAGDLGRQEQFLVVVSTVRPDATVQSSVVNAGVLRHPTSGEEVVGFVTYGATKLRNLRAHPQVAVTFRAGWAWVTVEGSAQLIGPDDPDPAFDAERLRLLLREVFVAAGGDHDDWEAYDRTMLEQRRTAVFVSADRVYGV
jgi:PPOX class probable F420-dependent enzyme